MKKSKKTNKLLLTLGSVEVKHDKNTDVTTVIGWSYDTPKKVNYLGWFMGEEGFGEGYKSINHKFNLADKFNDLKFHNNDAPIEWLTKTIIDAEMVPMCIRYEPKN